MLLGKTLNGNDVKKLSRERMALGLDMCVVVMSGVVDSSSLRNETKSLLREACAEHSTISHNKNQRKAKEK